MTGFTENYIKTEIPFNDILINELVKVKLMSVMPNGHVAATIV
jgi:threonylcarbamoyladenosine tRNA methylthiotransferase MtaB